MATYLLIGLCVAHATAEPRQDGERWLALTPPNGIPPPVLEVLSPAAGTILQSSDGPDLTLQLGLNVALWCSNGNGALNATNTGSISGGSEAAPSATTEAESAWTCAKLSDMVLCLEAVSMTSPSSSSPSAAPAPGNGERDAAKTIARQRCLPWHVAVVHSTISTAHLPTGAFELVARLVWAPFVDANEEAERDFTRRAHGIPPQSDMESSSGASKPRRNSNIVVNRDGTFEIKSGRSSGDEKGRSGKSSDGRNSDSPSDSSSTSIYSHEVGGGGAVAKWESSSTPIAMTREAGWSTDEATALAQLFPLDSTTSSHHQTVTSTSSSGSASTSSADTTRPSSTSSGTSTTTSKTAGLRLARTRHGPLLFNVRDLPAGISLDTQGEWEESVVRLLCSVLRPGDFVVDVGAHLGSFTVPLAKRVSGSAFLSSSSSSGGRAGGHRGRVLSFEPQADLYQALCANLALNGIFHVDARRAAVSSPDRAGDTITIPIRDPSHGASNFGGYSVNIEEADYARHGLNSQMNADDARPLSTTSTTTFSIVTLDDVLFADFKHRCPSLVKVDVEGEEEGVLKGLARTLYMCRPVLYLENQCASKSKTLLAELTHQGYVCWWDPAPYFSADNFRRMPLDQGCLQNPGISLNILCLYEGGQSNNSRIDSSSNHRPSAEGTEETMMEEERQQKEAEFGDKTKVENRRTRRKNSSSGSSTGSSRRGKFPSEPDLSRWRENWQALADVTGQLQRIDPEKPLVQQYTPLRFRKDVGSLGPGVSGLTMATC